MSPDAYRALILIHIVCMTGVLGGLIACLAAGRGAGNELAEPLRRAMRPLNLLLLVGLLAGFGLYSYRTPSGGADAGPLHALVGTKLLILLAVGALMGIASGALKRENAARARILQAIAAVLTLVAAALGVWV